MVVGERRGVAVLQQPRVDGELRRALSELSPKVLTQTLRSLERDGLVAREVRSVSPPHVEYALTEPGTSLVEAMDVFTVCAFAHMDRVRASREAYVERPPAWLVPREPVAA